MYAMCCAPQIQIESYVSRTTTQAASALGVHILCAQCEW